VQRLSLCGSDWQMAGFIGEDWRFKKAYQKETQVKDWLPATVPGSVHWDLLKAGEIPDPYFERNSRLVEWVHQRHWVYKRDVTVPAGWAGQRIFLQFDGIDYEAEVYLDGERLGAHHSMFVPALFEVTGKVQPGGTHHLAVAIAEAPREWPQLGRTSTVHTFKARMGYWWDFATRLVNLGLWQGASLFATGPVRLADAWVRTDLRPDHKSAKVNVTCAFDGGTSAAKVDVIDTNGAVVASGVTSDGRVVLEVADPALWWPNGWGDQPLYTCRVTIDGDSREVTFGIRTLTMEQNLWPPAGVSAEGRQPPLPYTFTVNGQRLFCKGWNWVPVDHMYGRPDLTERYEQLILLARAAGCNLLRVWGGGLIEKELFYDLCDRHGIMVWQEFIQSSSGTDNVPPSSPEMLALFEREARGIIPLRRNHACLAVWCGGNELMDWEKSPATTKEPALALFERLVHELDPGRAYLPTSSSGPLFDCGDDTGLRDPAGMHDVHGPWHYRGPVDSYKPYNTSAALFHSEFGSQGALAQASLDRVMARDHQWPPDDTNPLWVHHGAWWMQKHRVSEVFGDVETIGQYLPLSQYLHAESLRYAVEANRRRWPVCSGAMPWQLNEPWANSHCTSAVDYYLRPKMAYYYVKKAWAPVAASLRYEGQVLKDSVLRVTPFVVADWDFAGTLRLAVTDASGREWMAISQQVALTGEAAIGLQPVEWPVPAEFPGVVIVTATLRDADGGTVQVNPYLFGRGPGPILGDLPALPQVRLSIRRESDRLVLTNPGPGYAVFPAADLNDPRYHWVLDDNFPLMAPGEEVALTLSLRPRTESSDPDCPFGRTSEGPLKVTISGWNIRPASLIWEV